MDHETFRKRYVNLLENVIRDSTTNLIQDITLNDNIITKINKHIYTISNSGSIKNNIVFLIDLPSTPYYNIDKILNTLLTNKSLKVGVMCDPEYNIMYLLWVY